MPVTTQEMVDQAHTVFVGEEIARTEYRGNDQWASVAVTFQVAEAYKGVVSDQMTVITGMGGGDCGVSQMSGLVGITIQNTEEPSIDICGSVHDAGAVAALLDPVDIVSATPGPSSSPTDSSSNGLALTLVVAGAAAIVAGIGVAAMRRRRDDWQDGWSSEG